MHFRWGNGSRDGLLEWAIALAVLLIGGCVTVVVLIIVGLSYPPVCPNCAIPAPSAAVPPPASPAAVTIPAGGPAVGTLAEGNRFARELLAQIRPPAGARRVTSPPVDLRGPAVNWAVDNMADVATVWRVPLPAGQAVTFFKRHPPAGLRLMPPGSASQMTTILDLNVYDALEFGRGPVPAGIWAAQVVLSLQSDGAAASLVRADAQVAWYPPRSRAEYIGGLHAMTITGPQGSRTVTAPAVIARVARLLNALPTAPGGLYDNCAGQGDSYDVEFAVKRGAVPWAEAAVTQGCAGVRVTVDYQAQPTLADPGGKVVTYLASLMR